MSPADPVLDGPDTLIMGASPATLQPGDVLPMGVVRAIEIDATGQTVLVRFCGRRARRFRRTARLNWLRPSPTAAAALLRERA